MMRRASDLYVSDLYVHCRYWIVGRKTYLHYEPDGQDCDDKNCSGEGYVLILFLECLKSFI